MFNPGDRVWYYSVYDSEADEPATVVPYRGTVIDPQTVTEDYEHNVGQEDLLVLLDGLSVEESGLRSLEWTDDRTPHVYTEDYYGGYHSTVILVKEHDQ